MNLLLNNAKLQAPLAKLRNRISSIWRILFKISGHYQPILPEDKAFVLKRTITFKGDSPRQIAGGAHEQGRMVFRNPRPTMEAVKDLVVTPLGAAWVGRTLYERYSSSRPGLRMLLSRGQVSKVYPSGYFIQSAHRDTYGDWMSEYLGALARAGEIDAPLFLPAALARKPYVKRDLTALNINYIAVEHSVKIESAKVLRQRKHFVHFSPEDIAALRTILRITPQSPRVGSILYLSRRGEGSEVAVRRYPNEVVEKIVTERGGRVLLTKSTSCDEYQRAAVDAETVIFDHGSAMYNALGWRPKRIVELVSDDWWNNAFLMFADAMGVDDITIIRGDLGDAHVASMLTKALDGSGEN
ncbi:MAG: glycosyltransferase family 61 protein [Alphaproteobacteria bacterium]|nr:glycosyltransferase family 61 protein [Alphaproteobacteria bacterium]